MPNVAALAKGGNRESTDERTSNCYGVRALQVLISMLLSAAFAATIVKPAALSQNLQRISVSRHLQRIASFRTSSMSNSPPPQPRRTVTEALMAGARNRGRPPMREQARKKAEQDKKEEQEKEKVKEKHKDAEQGQNQGESEGQGLSVDEKVGLLKRKAGEFEPRAAAFWKDGERVPFMFLARALDLVSNESGRIAITEIMCNAFRTVIATTPEDLLAVVCLSANKVAPAHENVELGIGDAALVRSIAEAFGRKEEQVKSQLKALGDLGLVAKASRSSQRLMRKPTPLTCAKVLETFRMIAKESGKDSQDKKRGRIKNLLVAATDCEPLYLVRLLQEKMRIGLAEQTVLIALAHAAVYAEKPSVPSSQLQTRLEEAGKIVKQVYSVLPIYEQIVPTLINVGVRKLPQVCTFKLGVPISPMLAKPTKGVSEILDKFQDIKFTCEFKYDGERAQIHYMEDGTVEIYSRNAERNTGKFPDVVEFIGRCRAPSVASFVLDCEVVAYDRVKNEILPFQRLSTRARKDVAVGDIKVQVCIFAFDLLYLNGEQLLQEQLKQRRELLCTSFKEQDGMFRFASALESNDLEEIQKFLEEAVNNSCEGLIIKTLEQEATYEPAKRSNNWLKLKKDYMDSIGDSLDLVPIGAFLGRGKRTGVYGAFLLACYDDANEEFQSVCKIGTGFTEAVLEERSASLRSKVIPMPKSYYRYGESLGVDVWFEPSEVWEVKAADLTISPVHRAAAGVVDPNKGISLRFPRLLRVRDDKSPEQASTADQVVEMFRAQKIYPSSGVNDNNGEDDDY